MTAPDDRSWVDVDHWNLKVLCEVAEQGSFTLAARRLSMSQPGVSMVIHRLEERLGRQLVVRDGMHIELTRAGSAFYKHAITTIRSARELDLQMRALGRIDQSVTLGTLSVLSNYYLRPVIAEFLRDAPNASVHVVDVERNEPPEQWTQRGAEFLVMTRGSALSQGSLLIEELEQVPVVIVAAPDHPLAHEPAPTADDLAHSRIISTSNPSSAQFLLQTRIHKLTGIQVHPTIEVGPEGVKQLVADGLGIAVLPLFAVQAELDRGVLRHIVVPEIEISSKIVLVRRQDAPLSRLARILTDHLREHGMRSHVGRVPVATTV